MQRMQPLSDVNETLICALYAAMDAQVDVAVHTLVQLAPPSLYYHVRVVELLLWEPWAAPSDAQFAMLLMVCPYIFLQPLLCNNPHLHAPTSIKGSLATGAVL